MAKPPRSSYMPGTQKPSGRASASRRAAGGNGLRADHKKLMAQHDRISAQIKALGRKVVAALRSK
jgi:hypothetical protein